MSLSTGANLILMYQLSNNMKREGKGKKKKRHNYDIQIDQEYFNPTEWTLSYLASLMFKHRLKKSKLGFGQSYRPHRREARSRRVRRLRGRGCVPSRSLFSPATVDEMKDWADLWMVCAAEVAIPLWRNFSDFLHKSDFIATTYGTIKNFNFL